MQQIYSYVRSEKREILDSRQRVSQKDGEISIRLNSIPKHFYLSYKKMNLFLKRWDPQN